VLRHTAFFIFRDTITPEQHLQMLKGLAYMRFECKSVVGLDYGSDLFDGSKVLREVKPWDRTPLWHAAEVGPAANFDVALMLDFKDKDGLDAYNDDDTHHEVGDYNASIARPELTARVDWNYDGEEPLIEPGHVRHSAMFIWRDEADDSAKEEALEKVRALESASGVERVTIGKNIGPMKTDYDWLLDVQLPDADTAKALLEGEAYSEAMKAVAPATKYEWTARLSHEMRGM
jgi:hypothetical protein